MRPYSCRHHMAGMRWSETANFGTLPAPAMPLSFVAQVYDLGVRLFAMHMVWCVCAWCVWWWWCVVVVCVLHLCDGMYGGVRVAWKLCGVHGGMRVEYTGIGAVCVTCGSEACTRV